jgi:anti-sigma factor RsiW
MMICRLTQQWRSICGDSDRSGFVARHLATCPACKSLAVKEDRLIQRLRREAGKDRDPIPPFLHGKIVAALDREEKAAPVRQRRPLWASALAPMALLFMAALIWMRPQPMQNAHNRTPAEDAAVQQAILASAKYANGQLLLKLGENVENPLRREIASVVLDAKTAVNGIANRFLPENTLASNVKF